MLTGNCFTVKNNRSLPLNETQYLSQRASLDDLVAATINVTVGVAGLVLNSLSLVVFAKVFYKSSNRNNFHLFFVLLSVCEVAFCLGSIFTYSINICSISLRGFHWVGTDPQTGALIKDSFGYSVTLPSNSQTAAAAFASFVNLSNYLAVLSQFSRNWWVSITALLRCYVATRRTNVQVSQVYATGRVLFIYTAKVVIVLVLAVVRTYMKDPAHFMRMHFHVCNTTDWASETTVLLHMGLSSPKYWGTVNMVWIILSQLIPLVVIITSSVVLVFSLRSGAAGIGNASAERNKRVTRMVFIFALTFALLEGPRAVYFAVLVSGFVQNPVLRQRVAQITFFLSQADSIVNAFIYFFNDQHFRKELCGEPKQLTAAGQMPRQLQQQPQHQRCVTCEVTEMLPATSDGASVPAGPSEAEAQQMQVHE